MIERERSATASGGLRNGFAEWVCRSGGFNEWVRQSGGFVGVGLRNGFSGFLGFGLSLNKKKWRGRRSWKGLLVGALGIAR